MVFTASLNLQSVKRIPLIKFRYGPGISSNLKTTHNGKAGWSNVRKSVEKKPSASYSKGAIEDWELPIKYQRKPLETTEVEYINNGGPL